jgi:Tfp pilus assembly protein PilX
MKMAKHKRLKEKKAYALVLALAAALILALIGAGLLHICYGVRVRASRIKRETISMLAAEAGYEKAIFWMSQQPDVLSGLADSTSGAFGTINFENSYCDYEIQLHDFIGARPIFRVISTG